MLKKILASSLLFLFVSPVSAQILNPLPAKWRFGGGGIVVGVWGLSSCNEAFQTSVQVAQAFWTSQGRGSMVDIGQPNCSTGITNTQFDYRLSDDFPTTPNKTIGIHAHCATGANPSSNATHGAFCPVPQVSTHKGVGNCNECKQGNPVIVGENTNKVQFELDYAASGIAGLRFERVYNSFRSLGVISSPGVGISWTHTYARRLYFGGPNPSSITLVGAERPDGRTFAFGLSGGVYVSDSDMPDRLEKIAGDGSSQLPRTMR